MQKNITPTKSSNISARIYQEGGIVSEEVTDPTVPAEGAVSPGRPATPSALQVNPNTSEVNNPAAAKEDWFLTRVTASHVSTKNLFDLYGKEGFGQFKTKEEYWKNDKVREQFSNSYGSEAKMRFDEMYDNSKKEFANFQLGDYQRSQTGYELIRDDLSSMRTDAVQRFSNMAGTLKQGDNWSAPTKDYRENFSAIKVKEIDENGVETYSVKEYSPELLKELEQDPSFGGLAYSDAFYNLDPNEGVNGLYFNSIHNGRVLDEVSGKLVDVRNDQVVSRWDLDTGPTSMLGMFDVNLGQFFKNNKLEADGVLDYAKILVRSPMNMAVNVMDTAVQLTRASVAGGYGIANMFTDDDLDVRSSDIYKWLTTKGVKLKGNTTSMSREAMQDGFFGSLEAALTTTADVALQIALAGGLGRAGAGIPGMLDKGLRGEALIQAQNRSAEVFVRGTLTAMSVKDSYNEAIENGYSTSEASVITGAMAVAMWKATKYASYIMGDYEVKVLRENIKTAMQAEQKGMLKTLFESVPKAAADAGETKAKYALSSMQEAVSKVFGRVTKMLPSNKIAYIARQEGLEEMTEELFQDGVKQAASAYGTLINNAHAAGKGRYSTIFDDGYFKDAAERYLTSGVAGAIGGPMGMIGRKVELSPITSASSMTDILMSGRKAELLSVLSEMKNEGALGPKTLSTEYNKALEAFEPMIQGSGSESLADMVFKQYEHDINVVDTFINQGMFGKARDRIEESTQLKDFVDNNSMRKDYVKLMGSMLEFHSNTGISMAVYNELDDMEEGALVRRLPEELRKVSETIKVKNKEIEDIKASISKKSSAPTAVDKESEKPKTTDKKAKKEKVIGETEESKLTRLEKEVKLSSTVKDKDITTMLSNYRKIRAISTGAAAEYYLLQNDFADNTMLGAKYNREDKYSDLGEEPLKDMMMAMRFRSMADAKIHAQTAVKVAELEAEVLSFTDADEENLEKLEEILGTQGYSMLSEKALKNISKMYSKADVKAVGAAFDAKNEDSIFYRTADDKASEDDMLSLYKEIMGLSVDSTNMDALDSGELDEVLTPEIVAKFFKSLSKDIKKAVVPEWGVTMMGDGYEESGEGANLIDRIMSKGSKRLVDAVSSSGSAVHKAKELSEKADIILKAKTFYKEEPFKRKGIDSLFRRGRGTSLAKETLVEDGLSVVTALVDSGHEGIYTLTEHAEIDDVLSQIEVRLEMAKVLGTLTEVKDGKGSHYIKMLAKFRKNVLDIIDFKYDHNSPQDTDIEEHSYKDYTVTSDFFVDFVYDPILLMEIFSKDPALYTEEDKKVLDDFQVATSLLRPSAVKINALNSFNPNDLVAIDTKFDEELFFNYMDTVYQDNFLRAADLFENTQIIDVPRKVIGVIEEGEELVPIFFGGVTELLAAKWLFEKTREVIVSVADSATILPYIKAKDNDNKFTLRAFRDLIDDEQIVGLKGLIEEEAPELALALKQDADKIPSNDIGALNIQIESALFRIYNNTGLKNPMSEEESAVLNESIELYIYDINNSVRTKLSDNDFIKKGAEDSKKLSVLVGAVTTDFTPFYSKFKRDIEAMSPYDNIVVAAQEHAAKHAGAYIYSKKYKELADALTAHRLSFDRSLSPISAVYVTGIAGAGKSSAVIQTGLKIAMEIIEGTNNAVLPVSTYESQIEIITKSVGELSKGIEGMSVSELHKLLENAVNGKDQKAIDLLSKVGVIAIDEATYVEATSLKTGTESQLEQINRLIGSFNERENITRHKIGLLLLGDPKQSGSNTLHDDDIVYDTSLQIKRAHPISYMDFSFRSRNSFLVDSLSAVSTTIDKLKGSMEGSASFMQFDPGTKFGTTGGKYYGIKMVDASDNVSSEDFYKVLNDETLVSNIEQNILKTIAENNARVTGSPEVKFKILVAPSDIVSYNGTPSKIKTLSETPGYEGFFKVVHADKVGGSEANYVIGEIVNPSVKTGGEVTYLKNLGKYLNTLATRAFDFAVIVNRNDSIIIPFDAASREVPDGQVIIPSTSLDGAAKEKLKQNYLSIFKNITSDTSAPLVTSTAVIPGNSFIIPKDTFALNYTNIIQFTEGDKALLSHRGVLEVFENSDQDAKDIIASYLDQVKVLLVSTDIDQRADAITEADRIITKELKDIISQEVFEDLIGLQVFAADILSNNVAGVMSNVVSDILNNHINVAIDTLSMTEAVLEVELAPGINVASFSKEIENTLNDPTLVVTYENLFKASHDQTTKEYNNLLASFLDDVQETFGSDTDKVSLSTLDGNALQALDKLVNSLVLARSSFVLANLPKTMPDLDLAVVSKQLDEYSLWAESLSDDQLVELIKQFEPGQTGWKVVLPSEAADLYSLGFNRESVSKAFYDAALIVKAKRIVEEKEKEVYIDDMKRLDALKEIVGISTNIIGSLELYTEINKKEKKLIASLHGRVLEDLDYQSITDMIEIQNLWNKLYKGHTTTFGKDGYGKGFIYRNLTAKETLEDYITAAKAGNGVHTVSVTEYNIKRGVATAVQTPLSRRQVVLSPKQALNLFNFDKKSTREIPTKVILRLVSSMRKGIPVLDVLVMTPSGDTNYVLSQLNTEDDSPVTVQLLKEMHEAIDNDTTESFRVGGAKVMDLEIPGNVKEFMYTRPGGIVKPEDVSAIVGEIKDEDYIIAPEKSLDGSSFRLLTAEDFKGKVNLGNTIFAQTHKPIKGDAKKDIGNLLGESYCLYSANQSSSLDSKLIVDTIKGGEGLDSRNRIQDYAGSIPNQLGVMMVSLKAPLDKLGEVLKNNDDVSMGAFTSYFSIALQSHFIEYAANNFVVGRSVEVATRKTFAHTKEFKDFIAGAALGEEVFYNIEGVMRKFTVSKAIVDHSAGVPVGGVFSAALETNSAMSFTYTPEMASFFAEMDKDLQMHLAEKGDEYRGHIDRTLFKMKGSAELKTILDDFAKAFIVNKAMFETPTNTRQYSILYRSTSGGYVFNINEYLRNNPTSVLEKLTKLSDVAQFTLKPSIMNGNTVYAGVVNDVFRKNLSPYLQTTVSGIKIPSIEISSLGSASIRSAIRNLKDTKTVAVFDAAQVELLSEFDALNILDSVTISNKMLSLGEQKLAEMYDSAITMESVVKGNKDLQADEVLIHEMKSKIKGVLSIIQKLKKDGVIDGDPDTYLSDYAVTTESNSSFRQVLSAILLEYNADGTGDLNVQKGALAALKLMDESDEAELRENIDMMVGDDRMRTLLEGCKF